jgi:hypothetical protein
LVWQGGELPWVDILSLQSRMDPEPKARLTTLIRERLEKAQSGASAAELQWFDDQFHTIIRTEAARLNKAQTNSWVSTNAANSTTSGTQAGSTQTISADNPSSPPTYRSSQLPSHQTNQPTLPKQG